MSSPNVFAVARSIWDDEDFEPEPFSQREAFIWLVSAAAWRDCKVRGNHKQPIQIKRGEFSFSVRFLADKWDWTKSRVHRFLATLVKRGILRDTSRDGAQLFLLNNYNKFQVVGLPKRDGVADTSGTAAGQQRDKEETGKQLNRETEERRARDAALRSEFDLFWKGWPNKVGKPKALTAFKTARKSHSLQAIISGRDRYVRTKPPDRPWLNPATFLNQERFNDEPADADEKPKLRKWEGPDAESKTGPVFQGRADIRESEGSGRGGDVGEDRSRQRGMGEVVSLFDDDLRSAAGGDGSGRERGNWERDYAGSVS